MDNPKLYKCGYCGWMINSACENIMEHDCFKERTAGIENTTFNICADDKNVVKIVKNMENHWDGAAESEEQECLEELLISSVFTRRPLWDHRINVKERNSLKIKDLWQEIFLVLGEKHSVDYLKKRWRQLRDEFIRNRKKQNKYVASGSGAQDVPKKPSFKYYELMKFLDDLGENTQSQSNVPASIEKEVCSETNVPRRTESDSADLMSPEGSSSSSLFNPVETPSRKRKRETRGEPNTQLHEAILQTLGQRPREQDAVDGFCLMIGEGLRMLPFRKRSEIQIKIMQLLQEAEEDV